MRGRGVASRPRLAAGSSAARHNWRAHEVDVRAERLRDDARSRRRRNSLERSTGTPTRGRATAGDRIVPWRRRFPVWSPSIVSSRPATIRLLRLDSSAVCSAADPRTLGTAIAGEVRWPVAVRSGGQLLSIRGTPLGDLVCAASDLLGNVAGLVNLLNGILGLLTGLLGGLTGGLGGLVP